jgi:hypothetical protein
MADVACCIIRLVQSVLQQDQQRLWQASRYTQPPTNLTPHPNHPPPKGDVLEHAVLLALKSHDEAALERAFVQLKTFYSDTRWGGVMVGGGGGVIDAGDGGGGSGG